MTTTLMLLLLSGVLCRRYDVKYQQELICATTGSSVVMDCSFQYPQGTVEHVMWSHGRHRTNGGPYIYHSDPKQHNQTRFEYIGDTESNCSLKIHQVQPMDAGPYVFRFITTSDKWTSKKDLTLQVVDLDIDLSSTHALTEGRSVTLTCVDSPARHFSSAFLWFKNAKLVKQGAVLDLNNLSHTDSGNYTCSSETCVGTSGSVRIDVEYGPTNTSVSIIAAVSRTITLVCSSHANPPVETYTWFKTADSAPLMVGRQSVFSPGDGGQYFCSVTNKHGSHNSSTVKIEKASWTSFPSSHLRDGLIICSVAVLLILIAVVACLRFKKRRLTAKVEREEEVQVVHSLLTIQDPIYINCPVFNNDNQQQVVYAAINLDTRREKQTRSRDNDDDILYSIVCRI